jgi:hypothetical protein
MKIMSSLINLILSIIALLLFGSCFIKNNPYYTYISNILGAYAIFVGFRYFHHLKLENCDKSSKCNGKEILEFKQQLFNSDDTPKLSYYLEKANLVLLILQALVCATIGWWWSFFILSLISWAAYEININVLLDKEFLEEISNSIDMDKEEK